MPLPIEYPWHDALWRGLTARRERLPHALLLQGPRGLGKAALAARLARALLCLQPAADGEACGACKSCRLFASGTHPDFVKVLPAEEGKAILVDQIRALSGFFYLRPHTAARKIAVITPAEAMNLNAANSLLKVLEEPPLGSVLVLVSSQPASLPVTVRSRCSRLDFAVPPRELTLGWFAGLADKPEQAELYLELAGGAPLLALALAEAGFLEQRERLLEDMDKLSTGADTPLACAARWKQWDAERCLSWLLGFAADVIKLAMLAAAHRKQGGGAGGLSLANPDVRDRLQAMAERLNLSQMFGFFDIVSQARKLLSGPLDELLLLEDILIRWSRLSKP